YGGIVQRAYAALGESPTETVGWLGIAPVALLIYGAKRTGSGDASVRIWKAIAVVFFVWALGPFLLVGGVDTGLRLPAILFRYVPLVANARMPGRAMAVVYMAIGALLALQAGSTRGRSLSPALYAAAVVVVACEFWTSPLRLTPLDAPAVYRALHAAPPGAVCDVPLGVGDGLSGGVGSQDRRVLY